MRCLSVFLLVIFSLTSCTKPKEKIKVSKFEAVQDSIKLVADKLGVQVWFPRNFITTYEYQQYLRINNKLLLPSFTLVDIIDNDSTLMLTIRARKTKAIYIDIVCTRDQIRDILDKLGNSGRRLEYSSFFSAVIEITSIQKVKYGIESSIEDDSSEGEEGEPYTTSQFVSLILDVSDSYICKAKLIHLYANPEY